MLMSYVGISVIAVGLVLVLIGAGMALREGGILGEASDFVDSLTNLVHEIADKRPSLALFTFGTLLVFLGGIIAGVAGLSC